MHKWSKTNLLAQFLVASLALFAAVCAPLAAQTIVTGEIAGVVKDPSGAAIPNITVTAKSDATGEIRTATSNAQGEYHLPLLRPGAYTLSVTTSGFQPAELHVTASLGQIVNSEIDLSIKEAATSIDITIEAPLLQSENANVATTLSPAQLENLPAGGNDMVAFLISVPGVVSNTIGVYGSFSSFGLPATSNLFTLNGSDLMDPYFNTNNSGASDLTLGANEVQEVVVVNNGYTGQYGRQAGAQVNYISKSGSNAFHGNATWGWNGGNLNGNDFFNNLNGVSRPHEVSNQWAASIGGPIKKNKLFFFADQEGLRYVLPSGVLINLPTTAFANYVLTNLNATNPAAVPIYTKAFNLYAGASGASHATPVTAAIDPALGCGDFSAAGFGSTQPCSRQFQSSVNSLNTEWLLAERIDYNLTDKDRLFFRAWTDDGVQATGTDGINPAFNANSKQPQWSTQLGYTRVISPRAVNELLLSGFYYSALFGPPNLPAALAVFPTTFIVSNGLLSPMGGGAGPNGTTDSLSNYPNGRKVAQWQIVDDYAYTRGNHELKVGVNFKRNDVGDYAAGVNTSGTMAFNSMTDFVNGNLASGSSSYSQSFTRVGAEHIGLPSLMFYGQDQWHIRPNFTVTAAIQFAYNGNPTCGRDCYSRFSGAFQDLTHSASLPYNSAIDVGLNTAFKNLDGVIPLPRLGFAYSIDSKTVIRGGGGLFADQLEGYLNERFFLNAPNVASFTTTSGIVAPGAPTSVFSEVAASNAAFQSGFTNGATLAQLKTSVPGFTLPNFYSQADQMHVPRYLEWNFEIQRELQRHLILSVNYVGNHGWNEINQNPYLNAYSATGFRGLPTTAPDPRFGEINQLASNGLSNYNGLTSSLKWKLRSLQGVFSYTWAHTLDTCSNNCLLPFGLTTVTSMRYEFNPYQLNYGNADYDVRHSITANYLWTIPVHFQNSFLKRSLGGWSVSGVLLARTGFPFTVVNSSLRGSVTKNSTGIGAPSLPADWIGGNASTSCTTPNVTCFSKAEFLKTAQQTDFGNLARNSFRGPGYFDTDLNVNKNILATERLRFVVGASLFNVLNHPNFDLPVNNIGSGNFGQIIATVNPFSSAYGNFTGAQVSGRVVVLNAKFQF